MSSNYSLFSLFIIPHNYPGNSWNVYFLLRGRLADALQGRHLHVHPNGVAHGLVGHFTAGLCRGELNGESTATLPATTSTWSTDTRWMMLRLLACH